MKTKMIVVAVMIVCVACSLISFTSFEKPKVEVKSTVSSSNYEPAGGFISEDKL